MNGQGMNEEGAQAFDEYLSRKEPRGWKPEMLIPGEDWKSNGLIFPTKEEAELWARDLLGRWFVPTDSRAVPTDAEPNYRRRADGRIEAFGGAADGAVVKGEA